MQSLFSQVAEIEVSYRPAIANKPIIKSSYDSYLAFLKFYCKNTIGLQEEFKVMYINRSSRLLGIYSLSVGGITGSVADVRLIVGVALKIVASGIIISHNHPSCNLTPSKNDLEITGKIKEACSMFDLKLLDHIIISRQEKYLSLADEGLL